MKKMWKFRKDSRAVSPVIATILMVAITVVLAAVLYVMVMGFGGGETEMPVGSFTSHTKNADGNYTLTFGSFSPETSWQDVRFILEHNGTLIGSSKSLDSGNGSAIWTTDPGNITWYIFDLADDGLISSGDRLTIYTIGDEGMKVAGTWTVTLIHIPTGDAITSRTITVA